MAVLFPLSRSEVSSSGEVRGGKRPTMVSNHSIREGRGDRICHHIREILILKPPDIWTQPPRCRYEEDAEDVGRDAKGQRENVRDIGGIYESYYHGVVIR